MKTLMIESPGIDNSLFYHQVLGQHPSPVLQGRSQAPAGLGSSGRPRGARAPGAACALGSWHLLSRSQQRPRVSLTRDTPTPIP